MLSSLLRGAETPTEQERASILTPNDFTATHDLTTNQNLSEIDLTVQPADERILRQQERLGHALLLTALASCASLALLWGLHTYAGLNFPLFS